MFWVPIAMMAAQALMAKQRRDEMLDQQKRSAQASADATRVSWARKDGRGSIPETRWAEPGTYTGDMASGALSGYMQGQNIANSMGGQQSLFGSGQTAKDGGLDYQSLIDKQQSRGLYNSPYKVV